jgi:hypothetical protein
MRLAFAATVVMVVATTVLTVLNDAHPTNDWGTGLNGVIGGAVAVVFGFVGALIARRRDNPIGWILLAIGLGIAFAEVAAQYAYYAVKTEPGALPAGEFAASLGDWDYYWFVGLLAIQLPLVFPSGRLGGRRARIVSGLGAAAVVLASATTALMPGELASIPGITNPVGIDGAEDALEAIGSLGYFVYVVAILAAAAAMVRRFRRATGIERLHLKWFALAAAGIAISFVIVSSAGTPTTGSRIAGEAVSVAFAGLPVAVGIAVLRYRLYDIDLVINRALVYLGLTVTLVATYLAIVLLAQLVLPDRSDLGVAVSTLAAAAVFAPARRRIQAAVDRRFFRRRYDVERTLTTFGARLRDQVDLDALSADLRGVVADTMQPTHVSLWLR